MVGLGECFSAFLKNKVFCFCGVGGKGHCCESLFHQKAVQMREGQRLPAGQNHECLAFSLPTMLHFQAVLTCLPVGLAFRGGGLTSFSGLSAPTSPSGPASAFAM